MAINYPSNSRQKKTGVILPSASKYAILIPALISMAAYITVALIRIWYPFELEWNEGASAIQVRRILSGEPLYTAPSLAYIPMIYSPLYFFVCAAVAKLAGGLFLPLRLVSFISSIGSMILIYLFVRKEGYAVAPAVIASGLFAATFGRISGWFDIARVDSMFLFIALAALYVLRFAQTPWQLIISGILAALAFQTKQNEAVIMASMLLYSAIIYKRRAIYFAAAAVGLTGASIYLWDRLSDGWYRYYVFTLPSQAPIIHLKWITFWFGDLFPKLAAAITISGLYLFRGLDWTNERNRSLFYVCVTGGMVGASWMGRLHQGGAINVLMPAYAWISILFGLAVGWLMNRNTEPRGAQSVLSPAMICCVCVVQFAGLAYNPSRFIPNAADYKAGQELVRMVARTPGDVFIPFHPDIPLIAGKQTFLHRMVFSDIVRSEDWPMKRRMNHELNQAVRDRRFNMIILDDDWIQDHVSHYYRLTGLVFESPDVFRPRSGRPERPEFIYVRKDKKR